ncbi:hypothetical protein Ndes2526B_g02831 [Nannochloris sp. 'desiccata']|nr:hypothetical protein KSW81_006904 [Chlorella desiccata (nom. nud.)]KAH7622006.1 putative bifunctional riboflavin biosynthesis protein RIBA 2, chloroplastic [Chlorella desiccata (nom. nud.)]
MPARFISGVDQQFSATPSSLFSISSHPLSHGVRIPVVNRTIIPPAVLRSTSRGNSLRAEAHQTTTELPTPPPAFVAAIHAGRDLDTPAAGFDSIADALAAIARGETVVVLDDEDRENEGDLILAADLVTPEAMAFMVEHTSGVICIGMEGADLDRLRIPLMIPPADNEEAMSTAFTVTVDLREGTTTGISASDRSATLSALASPSSTPEDFKRPGHIFPLRYRPGGVLRRPGHTEAAVDLSRLAGRAPAGVLCEIVNKDGTMARTPELLEFAARYGLKCITIADLVRYRLKHEPLIQRVASGELPTRYGRFTAYAYRSLLDGTEHIALVVGNVDRDTVLARVHSESMLGDIFGSERCDSGSQLDAALEQIAKAGNGVLVYLRGQQGRGLGLADELKAYTAAGAAAEVCVTPGALEDSSFPVDARDYGVAAHILKDLKVGSVQLLTNNTTKLNCMKAHGIKATAMPLLPPSASNNHDANGNASHGRRSGSEPHFV